jgi:hypothetical protein
MYNSWRRANASKAGTHLAHPAHVEIRPVLLRDRGNLSGRVCEDTTRMTVQLPQVRFWGTFPDDCLTRGASIARPGLPLRGRTQHEMNAIAVMITKQALRPFRSTQSGMAVVILRSTRRSGPVTAARIRSTPDRRGRGARIQTRADAVSTVSRVATRAFDRATAE